jgi:hypothetical protein
MLAPKLLGELDSIQTYVPMSSYLCLVVINSLYLQEGRYYGILSLLSARERAFFPTHDEARFHQRKTRVRITSWSSSRLARLINSRFDMEPRWSEMGDRYVVKLFRDFVFHQVDEDGNPLLDLGHVMSSLNKVSSLPSSSTCQPIMGCGVFDVN